MAEQSNNRKLGNRSTGAVSVKDFGASTAGTAAANSTAIQAAIDSFASDGGTYQILVPAGSYTVGTLTEGTRSIVWVLQAGATVTQGKLPGRVIRATPASISTPQSTWVFGETPYTFEDIGVTSASVVGPQTQSGFTTVALNGMSSGDNLVVSPKESDNNDGLIPYSYDVAGRNLFGVRFLNGTGSNKTINTRTFNITVAKQDDYRQVFAISKYLGKDSYLCGVDRENTKGTCIWRTNNAGSSWKPVYSLSAKGVRNIIELTANTNSAQSDLLDTVLLATLSAPGTNGQTIARSADGGATWTVATQTLSAGTIEDLVYGADVEGGQGTGGSYVLAGTNRTGADATIYQSTDIGVTFGTPIVVDAASGYESVWQVMWISGAGASSVWLAFLHRETDNTIPAAVYTSTNGGTTWAALSTVGANGDEWQAAILLASGTILSATTNAGNVYRSTDSGATWTATFSAAAIKSSETKMRSFHQTTDGVIYAMSQDGGFIWASDDDGRSFFRLKQIGGLHGPNIMVGSDQVLLTGGGQNYITGTGGRAEIYRSFITSFNDSE